MRVSIVDCRAAEKAGPTLAYVDVLVDDMLCLNGMRIVEAKARDGGTYHFVGSPSYRSAGGYRDYITGISREFSDAVVSAWRTFRGLCDDGGSFHDDDAIVSAAVTPYRRERAGGIVVEGLASISLRSRQRPGKSAFSVNGIALMRKDDGPLFIGMPRRAGGERVAYVLEGARGRITAIVMREAKSRGIRVASASIGDERAID